MRDFLGRVVVAVDGVNREPNFTGECFGYICEPTYLIKKDDGSNTHWAHSITRLATPEEELAYWRERALKAELKARAS